MSIQSQYGAISANGFTALEVEEPTATTGLLTGKKSKCCAQPCSTKNKIIYTTITLIATVGAVVSAALLWGCDKTSFKENGDCICGYPPANTTVIPCSYKPWR